MGKSETKQLTNASLFAAYLEILNRNTWGVVWKFVDLITTYYKQMACLYTRLYWYHQGSKQQSGPPTQNTEG